eukprot:jgi/Botrbrau1/15464/Bobra.43_2s0087.1
MARAPHQTPPSWQELKRARAILDAASHLPGLELRPLLLWSLAEPALLTLQNGLEAHGGHVGAMWDTVGEAALTQLRSVESLDGRIQWNRCLLHWLLFLCWEVPRRLYPAHLLDDFAAPSRYRLPTGVFSRLVRGMGWESQTAAALLWLPQPTKSLPLAAAALVRDAPWLAAPLLATLLRPPLAPCDVGGVACSGNPPPRPPEARPDGQQAQPQPPPAARFGGEAGERSGGGGAAPDLAMGGGDGKRQWECQGLPDLAWRAGGRAQPRGFEDVPELASWPGEGSRHEVARQEPDLETGEGHGGVGSAGQFMPSLATGGAQGPEVGGSLLGPNLAMEGQGGDGPSPIGRAVGPVAHVGQAPDLASMDGFLLRCFSSALAAGEVDERYSVACTAALVQYIVSALGAWQQPCNGSGAVQFGDDGDAKPNSPSHAAASGGHAANLVREAHGEEAAEVLMEALLMWSPAWQHLPGVETVPEQLAEPLRELLEECDRSASCLLRRKGEGQWGSQLDASRFRVCCHLRTRLALLGVKPPGSPLHVPDQATPPLPDEETPLAPSHGCGPHVPANLPSPAVQGLPGSPSHMPQGRTETLERQGAATVTHSAFAIPRPGDGLIWQRMLGVGDGDTANLAQAGRHQEPHFAPNLTPSPTFVRTGQRAREWSLHVDALPEQGRAGLPDEDHDDGCLEVELAAQLLARSVPGLPPAYFGGADVYCLRHLSLNTSEPMNPTTAAAVSEMKHVEGVMGDKLFSVLRLGMSLLHMAQHVAAGACSPFLARRTWRMLVGLLAGTGGLIEEGPHRRALLEAALNDAGFAALRSALLRDPDVQSAATAAVIAACNRMAGEDDTRERVAGDEAEQTLVAIREVMGPALLAPAATLSRLLAFGSRQPRHAGLVATVLQSMRPLTAYVPPGSTCTAICTALKDTVVRAASRPKLTVSGVALGTLLEALFCEGMSEGSTRPISPEQVLVEVLLPILLTVESSERPDPKLAYIALRLTLACLSRLQTAESCQHPWLGALATCLIRLADRRNRGVPPGGLLGHPALREVPIGTAAIPASLGRPKPEEQRISHADGPLHGHLETPICFPEGTVSLLLEAVERVGKASASEYSRFLGGSNPLPVLPGLSWRTRLMLLPFTSPGPHLEFSTLCHIYMPPSLSTQASASEADEGLPRPIPLCEDALCFVGSSKEAASALAESAAALQAVSLSRRPSALSQQPNQDRGPQGLPLGGFSPGELPQARHTTVEAPGVCPRRDQAESRENRARECVQRSSSGDRRGNGGAGSGLVLEIARMLLEALSRLPRDACRQALVVALARIAPHCTADELDRIVSMGVPVLLPFAGSHVRYTSGSQEGDEAFETSALTIELLCKAALLVAMAPGLVPLPLPHAPEDAVEATEEPASPARQVAFNTLLKYIALYSARAVRERCGRARLARRCLLETCGLAQAVQGSASCEALEFLFLHLLPILLVHPDHSSPELEKALDPAAAERVGQEHAAQQALRQRAFKEKSETNASSTRVEWVRRQFKRLDCGLETTLLRALDKLASSTAHAPGDSDDQQKES